MKSFIFISSEGFTQQPNGDNIENCQVIGYGKGNTTQEALLNMLNEISDIKKTSFIEIIGIEILNDSFGELLFLPDYVTGEKKCIEA